MTDCQLTAASPHLKSSAAAFMDEASFLVFQFLDAHAALCAEITCSRWRCLLKARTDVWLRQLDRFFGEERSDTLIIQGELNSELATWNLKMAWKYCIVRPSSALLCSDAMVVTSGTSARLLSFQPLGRRRSLVGNQPLSYKLPMCWPREGGCYGLAYYAYWEVKIDDRLPMRSETMHLSPVITIGIATSSFHSATKLPGFDVHSIAFDGVYGVCLFNSAIIGRATTFGLGDIVGCGLADCGGGRLGIFFVKNGSLVRPRRPLFKTFLQTTESAYPVIGFDTHSRLEAYFTTFPSGFDIFRPLPAIDTHPHAHLERLLSFRR